MKFLGIRSESKTAGELINDSKTKMSTKGGVYTVDDELMSSQGSVNAPTHVPIPPVVPTDAQITAQSAVGPHVPTVETTVKVVLDPGVSRQEAQLAFAQVSKALGEMTSEHGHIRTGLHALASQLVEAKKSRDQDIEVVAQENLSRTSSVRSEMDAQFSVAHSQQMQAQAKAEEAKLIGERALLEAEKMKVE